MPWGPQPGPFGVPHLWWFAVDPDLGRKGIGSKMLAWCEETMVRDTLKSPAVSLGTAKEHPWLGDMYVRRGYVPLLEKDLGKGHTTVFYKKRLLPAEGEAGPMSASHYDVLVIGAGSAGMSAGCHLARRGARVLLIDAFDPPRRRGQPPRETRLIRHAYKKAVYIPLALRADELWRSWSRRRRRRCSSAPA